MEGVKHNLQDGDEIEITEVDGMEELLSSEDQQKDVKVGSINSKRFKVKVENISTLQIGDTSIFGPYKRNGKIKEIKTPTVMTFHPITKLFEEPTKFIDPNLLYHDFSKMDS